MIFGDWSPAVLTVQISPDDGQYTDLSDEDGSEVVLPVGARTAYFTRRAWVEAIRWMKLRSGSRNAPEPQTQDRTITLVIET